ncbi:MAG: M13 family peptidase, partial [Terracidiphilus sp.]
MKLLRYVAFVLLAAGTVLTQAAAAQQADDSTPTAPPAVKSFDPAAIDKTVDPCVNFYQYACGNWIKSNPVPADQVRWLRSFSTVAERNRYLLWKDLDAAAKDPRTPLQRQYGDFYAACMDTAAVDKAGLTPIEPAWAAIARLNDPKQLAGLLSDLENHGTPDGFFDFGVGQDEKNSSQQIAELFQGGLSLPDREYYLNPAAHYATIRAEYIEHMKKMFALAGDTPDAAATEAAAVMTIETAMAKASMSRTEMRQPENRYHIYTVAELDKLSPDFNWTTYFWSTGIGHFDRLNVGTPDYFKALSSLIQTEPLDAWKSYLRWHVLHGEAEYLPKAFYDANFDFFQKTLAGQKEPTPRWKMCTA